MRELTAISGELVAIPDPNRLVHLQLRRFAGCPICNLHLRSIVLRHDEIEAAGIREVVVFHSTEQELAEYAPDFPFAVIADPDRELYAEFGVETAPRALLDPRVWLPLLRSIVRASRERLRGGEPLPGLTPRGGRLGLPGDFLIAPDGRIVASKLGEHAYDQWTVDELLASAVRATLEV